jgi:hypothetical protein
MTKKTFQIQDADGVVHTLPIEHKASAQQALSNQDFDSLQDLVDSYGKINAKSGIYIKPSKRGTFTAAAKKRGKGVQEFAQQVLAHKENYSSAMVKKANFARNAAKWNKAEEGMQVGQDQQMQQMQQIAQMVAQALQQGADPNQILQMLVQQGVPQEVAQQVIQMVMQQMQGQQQPQQEPQMQQPQMQEQMPSMEYGGSPREMQMQQQMQQQQPRNQGTPQEGDQQQMEQVMAMVAQALQQGANPQQIMQMLVQQGVPQQVAQQVIAQVMQSMQQQPEEEVPMEQAPRSAMGMRVIKAQPGVGMTGGLGSSSGLAMNPQLFALEQQYGKIQTPPADPRISLPSVDLGYNRTVNDIVRTSAINPQASSQTSPQTSSQASSQTSMQSPDNSKRSKNDSLYRSPWLQGSDYNTYNIARNVRDARDSDKLLASIESGDASGYTPEDTKRIKTNRDLSNVLTAGYSLAAARDATMTGLNAYVTDKRNRQARAEYASNMQLDARSGSENQPYSPGYETKSGNLPMSKWGGRIKPCKDCDKKKAYGGKLGFIARKGMKVEEAEPEKYNVITERNEIINNKNGVYRDGGVPHSSKRGGNYKYLIPGSVVHSQVRGTTPEDLLNFINYLYPENAATAKYGMGVYAYGGMVPTVGADEVPEIPMEEAVMQFKDDLSKLNPNKPQSFASLLKSYTTEKEDKVIEKANDEIEYLTDAHLNPTGTSIARKTAELNAKTWAAKKKSALESKGIKMAITGPDSPVFALAENDRQLNGLNNQTSSKYGKKIALVDVPKVTAAMGMKASMAQDGTGMSTSIPQGTRLKEDYADGTSGYVTYNNNRWVDESGKEEGDQDYYSKYWSDTPEAFEVSATTQIPFVGPQLPELTYMQAPRKQIESMNMTPMTGFIGRDLSTMQPDLNRRVVAPIDRTPYAPEKTNGVLVSKEGVYYDVNDVSASALQDKAFLESMVGENLSSYDSGEIASEYSAYLRRNNKTLESAINPVTTTSQPVVTQSSTKLPRFKPSLNLGYNRNVNQIVADAAGTNEPTSATVVQGVTDPNQSAVTTSLGQLGPASTAPGVTKFTPTSVTNFKNIQWTKGDKPTKEQQKLGFPVHFNDSPYAANPAQGLQDLVSTEFDPSKYGKTWENFSAIDVQNHLVDWSKQHDWSGVKELYNYYKTTKNAPELQGKVWEELTDADKEKFMEDDKYGVRTYLLGKFMKSKQAVPAPNEKATYTSVNTGFTGNLPKGKNKNLFYDPLHPMAVAGPLMELLTPRDVTPFIEDTGAKDALAASTRRRFTEIQPQLNRLRRATRAQTRGVGMDPVSQAQMAQAYANEYEAAAQAYGEKYNRDAAIEKDYIDMQNQLRREAGSNRAKALDLLAQREATSRWKKTAMDINALNTLADRYLKNRTENRASLLYQDMFDNVGYDGYTTYTASNGEYPFAPGTSGRPLTKEQLEYESAKIKNLKDRKEAKELGLPGYRTGGKIKLPKKSVKRMSKVS